MGTLSKLRNKLEIVDTTAELRGIAKEANVGFSMEYSAGKLSFEDDELSFAKDVEQFKAHTPHDCHKKHQEPKPMSKAEKVVVKQTRRDPNDLTESEERDLIDYLNKVIVQDYHKELTSFCEDFLEAVNRGIGSVNRKTAQFKLGQIRKCIQQMEHYR